MQTGQCRKINSTGCAQSSSRRRRRRSWQSCAATTTVTHLRTLLEPAIGPSQNLIHSDEFVAMLLEFPNLVAWVNGHTHINTITAHPRAGSGGFWEITTASCVDYPQQQQVIEIVDNRDSTLSIFTTTVDHQSSAAWESG